MPRILVIDDDRSVRHLIEKTFADSDVEVLTAASAEEGRRLQRESRPDVGATRYFVAHNLGASTV